MFNDTLGGIYGREDLETEFKTVCIRGFFELDISTEEAEDILENYKWDHKLSICVDKTMLFYFNNVLPKYISSFCNSDINGTFIMGVDDDGEISGIPFYKEANIDKIKDSIIESIRHNISFENTKMLGDNIDMLVKNIHIDVVKLKINKDLVEDEHIEIYEEYKRNFVKRNNMIEEYQNRRHLWLNELQSYSTKLVIIINNTKRRLEMIEYIKQMKDNILTEKQKQIIELLKTDDYISTPKFPELDNKKKDPDDVIYWLVKFKDYMTEIVNKKRPNKLSIRREYNPIQIVSKLPILRGIFTRDSNIIYYIIKISIKYTKFDSKVLYKFNGNYKSKKRMIDDYGPYSE